jgi:hypothetical protein
MTYWPKAPSSRPILTTTFTSATAPVKAGVQCYQIRAVATAASWLSIGDSSGIVPSTGVGVPISANVAGEVFTISPGQWYGAAGACTVTEMS